jgi:hypothetical protein
MSYKAHHERSIKDPDGFWGEQAQLIHWEKPFDKVLNYTTRHLQNGLRVDLRIFATTQ